LIDAAESGRPADVLAPERRRREPAPPVLADALRRDVGERRVLAEVGEEDVREDATVLVDGAMAAFLEEQAVDSLAEHHPARRRRWRRLLRLLDAEQAASPRSAASRSCPSAFVSLLVLGVEGEDRRLLREMVLGQGLALVRCRPTANPRGCASSRRRRWTTRAAFAMCSRVIVGRNLGPSVGHLDRLQSAREGGRETGVLDWDTLRANVTRGCVVSPHRSACSDRLRNQ